MPTPYNNSPQEIAQEMIRRYEGLDPERVKRALDIVSRAQWDIFHKITEAGKYRVRGTKGWYEVDINKHSCSCTDSRTGHVCKHRIAAWIYAQSIARAYGQGDPDRITKTLKELGYT